MDIEIIKLLSAVPALGVLVFVLIRQQMQIEKLVDSMIRMQDCVTRNVGYFVGIDRRVFDDRSNSGEGQ